MRLFMLAAVVLIVGGLVVSCGPTHQAPVVSEAEEAAEAAYQERRAFQRWHGQHVRVFNIWDRLAAANAEFCPEKIPAVGWWVSTPGGVSETLRGEYVRKFGGGDIPRITYLHAGGVAEKAGMRAGDQVVSVNGVVLAIGWNGQMSNWRTWKETSPLKVEYLRGGKRRLVNLTPVEACKFNVVVGPETTVNATASIDTISVSVGMLDFLTSDDDLALVIGHELAHHTEGHIGKSLGNSVLGGLLVGGITAVLGGTPTMAQDMTRLGMQAGQQAFTQEFESEADYVGLYFTARAGYRIDGAAELWRRMGELNPNSINFGSTHPTSAKRSVALSRAVREIEEMRRVGQSLRPKRLKEAKQ